MISEGNGFSGLDVQVSQDHPSQHCLSHCSTSRLRNSSPCCTFHHLSRCSLSQHRLLSAGIKASGLVLTGLILGEKRSVRDHFASGSGAGASLLAFPFAPRDDPAGTTMKEIQVIPAYECFIPVPKTPQMSWRAPRKIPTGVHGFEHPSFCRPGQEVGMATPSHPSSLQSLFQPEFPGLCKVP